MQLLFEDPELEEAYRQPPAGVGRWGAPLVRSLRRALWFLDHAESLGDVAAMRSLGLASVPGRPAESSLRLEVPWRLLVTVVPAASETVVHVHEIVGGTSKEGTPDEHR